MSQWRPIETSSKDDTQFNCRFLDHLGSEEPAPFFIAFVVLGLVLLLTR